MTLGELMAEIMALRGELRGARSLLAATVLQAGGNVKIEARTVQNMRPDSKIHIEADPMDSSVNLMVTA